MPRHRGARQNVHPVGGRKSANALVGPVELRAAVDGAAGDIGKPAEARVLVGDEDARTTRRRGFRRRQPRHPGADDEHVAPRMHLLVAVGVAARRRRPEPRRPADQRLVDPLPEALRPHQRLVVESRRDDARDQAVDRSHIPLQARPAVLADGGQPLMQLDLRGAQVRLVPSPLADADQRVGLLRAQPDKPARPMVLEAAAEQRLAVGEHRRGQRVAGKARHAPAVEGETQRLRPVDEPARARTLRQSVGLSAHFARSSASLSAKNAAHSPVAWRMRSRGGRSVMPYVALNSMVTVSRAA
jgi:hypothetical protein